MVGSGILEVAIITIALVSSVIFVYFIMKSVLAVSNDIAESLELASSKHVYMAVGIWLGTAVVLVMLTTVLYMAAYDIDDVYTGMLRLLDAAFLGKPIAFYTAMVAVVMLVFGYGMMLVADPNALYSIDPSFNFSVLQSWSWSQNASDTSEISTEIMSPASRTVRSVLIMAFILCMCMPTITHVVVRASIM